MRALLVFCTTALTSVSALAQWTPLQTSDVGPNFCTTYSQTSPIKEYFEVKTCKWDGAGNLPNNSLECEMGTELTKFYEDCSNKPMSCNLVSKSVLGTVDDEAKMFRALLATHPEALTKKVLQLPKYYHYLASSCFQRGHNYMHESIEALGITGKQEDVSVLNNLLSTQFFLDNVSNGRATRKKLAEAYWFLGNKTGAESMMKMLTIGHIKRYQGREFRENILMNLAAWDSPVAESLCEDNMADITSEGDLAACYLYLAKRKKTSATKSMVRNSQRAGDAGIAALGVMGGAAAKKHLKSLSNDGGPAYVGLNTALFNAGDAKAWKAVEKVLKERSPSKSQLAPLAFLASNAKAAKKAVALLKKLGKKWKKDNKDEYAYSLGIRLQLGDSKVVKEASELLDDPDRDVRTAVVMSVGGDFGNVWDNMPGYSMVDSEKLMKAMAAAHKAESDKGLKEKMARAALSIRAVIRSK